ncbi:MAG TPA: ImmA/IrrE family metallo-endopeptidase [bacterium]|nr:ImmA/IrrE family metallo-endopeptidase [bacterium]
MLTESSAGTTRHCDTCGAAREPFFDSPCEDPVAWLCPACRTVETEVPRTSLSPEARRELGALEAFMQAGAPPPAVPAAAQPAAASVSPRPGAERTAGPERARERARQAASGSRELPVDIRKIAGQLGFPVQERALPPGQRGTIGRDGGRVVIAVSSRGGYTDAELRWIVAEELGHAALGHTALVASSAPGAGPAIAEPRRREEEREARAFAAEILMPEEKIRARFAELAPRIDQTLGMRQRETETDDVVHLLARMFGVTPTALRRRLEELGLLR